MDWTWWWFFIFFTSSATSAANAVTAASSPATSGMDSTFPSFPHFFPSFHSIHAILSHMCLKEERSWRREWKRMTRCTLYIPSTSSSVAGNFCWSCISSSVCPFLHSSSHGASSSFSASLFLVLFSHFVQSWTEFHISMILSFITSFLSSHFNINDNNNVQHVIVLLLRHNFKLSTVPVQCCSFLSSSQPWHASCTPFETSSRYEILISFHLCSWFIIWCPWFSRKGNPKVPSRFQTNVCLSTQKRTACERDREKDWWVASQRARFEERDMFPGSPER